MSTSTVTRSIPTTSINDVPNLNTTTVAPTTTSTTTTPSTLPATVLLPTVESKSTVFPPVIKKDTSNIPPAFFVGPHENENTVIFEPQLSSSDSGSVIGYGDRRLSGILAETTEKPKEEKKEETPSEVPAKRVILDSSDATRGIFGDKRKRVASSSNTTLATTTALSINNKTTEEKSNGTTEVIILQESKTIKVFGYPSNLKHNVIQHFMTYGKIADSGENPGGNWMTITYESSSAALAALKSNGIVISKTHMIGVSLEKETTNNAPITPSIIPMDDSNGVYKDLNPKKNNGLGSGKVGVSAVDKYNAAAAGGEVFTNHGIISRLKDTFFGW